MDEPASTVRWRTVRARVDRIVASEDPEGLLAAGAPEDEYRPEIDELAGLVLGGAVDADRVRALWERWFGPGSALSRSPRALDRLTAALVELQQTDPGR